MGTTVKSRFDTSPWSATRSSSPAKAAAKLSSANKPTLNQPICPTHKLRMNLKTATKGPRKGKQFYGCPKYFSYEGCRYTINVP